MKSASAAAEAGNAQPNLEIMPDEHLKKEYVFTLIPYTKQQPVLSMLPKYQL